MLRFFRKYEFHWKIIAAAVWIFVATDKLFLRDDPEKRNWNLAGGIVFLILGLIYVSDVIELIKKRTVESSLNK